MTTDDFHTMLKELKIIVNNIKDVKNKNDLKNLDKKEENKVKNILESNWEKTKTSFEKYMVLESEKQGKNFNKNKSIDSYIDESYK